MTISNKFGTSPVGSIRAQTKQLGTTRAELLQSIGEFLAHEPTVAEMEVVDALLSAFTWSYKGYSLVFDTAVEAHKIVQKEEPRWKKKSK